VVSLDNNSRYQQLSAMPADPTQHQHLCIFRLLLRLDFQHSTLVVNFNSDNVNQQQFQADEQKIPAQQKADGR
jgi:hypothetical protein